VLDRAGSLQDPASDAQELLLLRRRMGLLSRAIESVTVTGVLVALVVAVTFISAIAVLDLAAIVVLLFVLAMLALILGLMLLLMDTRVASRMMRRVF
jgi:Zn-dependent protease